MNDITRIEMISEPNVPRAICPHCKQVLKLDITMFKDNAAKIMESRCPLCSGKIYTGLMILCHPKLEGLLYCIRLMADSIKTENKMFVKP
jgi:hypothetical protein